MTPAFGLPLLRLVWADPGTGDSVSYSGGLPITLGRTSENDIVLNSEEVSRRHARLEARADEIYLIDLGSTNGVSLNGEQVSQALINHGDTILIGPFSFDIIISPALAASPDNLAEQMTTFILADSEHTVLIGDSDDDTPTAVFDVTQNRRAQANQSAHEIRLSWTDPNTEQSYQRQFRSPISFGRSSQNVIALQHPEASRNHAVIEWQDDEWILTDKQSTNGTLHNDQEIEEALLQSGDTIHLGGYTFAITIPSQPDVASPSSDNALDDQDNTILFNDQTGILDANFSPNQSIRHAEFPPPPFEAEQVSVAELKQQRFPLDETTYLALGGGMGSFIWVDNLMVCGADPAQIVSVGFNDKPYGRFKRLCYNSQIPNSERLRSNSDACPDNIWGWPSYAVREMWQYLKLGRIRQAAAVGWQVFNEPDLTETYNPKAGAVYAAMDREAARIGWSRIWRFGRIRAIRKTDDGRYVVAYTQQGYGRPQSQPRKLIISKYLHISLGYPAIRLLPDLQHYREQTEDFRSVVNAYEDHDHVYKHLLKYGGTVLIRGRGIVASRIVQRLYEVRQKNPNIGILHLMRTPLSAGHRFGRTQRVVRNHWEIQPFNWPKSVWGGDLRIMLAEGHDAQRDQLLNDWGGTTTSDRRDWIAIIERGQREGWYQIRFGQVETVTRNETGKLITTIRGKGSIQETMQLETDFIIDATGLVADLESNPLLKDLVDHYNLDRNPKGRFLVNDDFEISGLRNGTGRAFASGIMTLGGPYAPVDSFLGMQYTAQQAVGALVRLQAPGLRKLNSLRSARQWLRWCAGKPPQ